MFNEFSLAPILASSFIGAVTAIVVLYNTQLKYLKQRIKSLEVEVDDLREDTDQSLKKIQDSKGLRNSTRQRGLAENVGSIVDRFL